jgi:3-isopropylmalate/(R)-2-methylmalate dehydratase large subunit
MGMTIAEKIIALSAGKDSVKAGEIHTVELDYLMSNDGTTHLTIDMYRQLKRPRIADRKKLVWIVDHNVPCDSPKTAASQKKMRDFAKEEKIDFHEGEGICHQIMAEKYVSPGMLIFGADSHTCTYGALGAFGTGVGCTDYLYGMVTGKSWVMVPETLRFNLHGTLKEGVTARDLMLTIIGRIGANGANYKAMEFAGEGLHSLTMSDRLSVCNLAVEAGAKTALMDVDDITLQYLKEHGGREPKAVFRSDEDADFAAVYDIRLEEIVPVVAKPHFVDNIAAVSDVKGVKIDEAFLGSCNNGRIEDLRLGAAVIKGKKVSPKVRFLVVPASQEVYLKALDEGLLDIFLNAGAIVMNPNCSVCWGSCQGVIGAGETLISTGTRNFKGRAGDKDSFVYLGSALTVTASAVAGYITGPDGI